MFSIEHQFLYANKQNKTQAQIKLIIYPFNAKIANIKTENFKLTINLIRPMTNYTNEMKCWSKVNIYQNNFVLQLIK